MPHVTPWTPINNPLTADSDAYAVLTGADSVRALRRGFDAIADAVAVTLGPAGRHVIFESEINRKPELISDAAIVARRIVSLPDRAQDTGAMLLRHMLWRMHEQCGDGAATVAVIAQCLLREAARLRAAGANVMTLRDGIQAGAAVAIKRLDEQARPVRTHRDIAGLAHSITGERVLSDVLGEMFYNLGPEAHIVVEEYVAPYLERVYVDGGRWIGRIASPYLYSDPPGRRSNIDDCAIAVFAGDVTDFEDVGALLELVAHLPEGRRRIALLAYSVSGVALSTLIANHQAGTAHIAAVELRRAGAQRDSDLDDIATLTGATVVTPERGRSLRSIAQADIGLARRIEVSPDDVIVAGGSGSDRALKRRLAALRTRLRTLSEAGDERTELHERIARLVGRVAYLKIGAYTDAARGVLKSKAEKALRAIPFALNEGVVPGSGAAYLRCADAVRAMNLGGEQGWGAQALARALEEPFRRIALGAGIDEPATVMAAVRRRQGLVLDATARNVVPAGKSGILDPAGVARLAIETAVSGATMVMSVEAIVLRKVSPISYQP